MSDLRYEDEVFKLVGHWMEVHHEPGKGQDQVLYKDAFVVELRHAQIPFACERKYEVTYKGVILPHHYYVESGIWAKILYEAKAVERLADAHVKQVLNYLAVSKLELGLLMNFGGDSLEWKRIIHRQNL